VEIHLELCTAVYSQNVMSQGTVRQWRRMFKDGRTDLHDEEGAKWSAISSDNLVESVDQKICETLGFTI
jgi:hypothetical protein